MRTLVLFAAGVLVLCAAGRAVANSELVNELQNPGVEQGWQFWPCHGSGLLIGPANGHGNAVYCKDPGGDRLIRQVVDESQYPGWNPAYHAKWIDLSADILCMDLGGGPESAVKFRIDWWNENRNSINYDVQRPKLMPPPDGVSEWVTIHFAHDVPRYKPFKWFRVHPFEWNRTLFERFQPRYVSVEVKLVQALGETVWVDNFEFYGKCVPEPSMLVALLTGLGGLGVVRRFRRR